MTVGPFEIKEIDLVNAVAIALVFGLALGIAVSRYIIFAQQIERVATFAQQFYCLHQDGDVPATRDRIRAINIELGAIILSMRAAGHLDASQKLRDLWKFYQELFIDATKQVSEKGSDERTRAWFAETSTNFAIRVYRLRPNYGALFRLYHIYADADLVEDEKIDKWRGPKPPKQPPII